jgi:predicted MFS family arabinose efflux permease
VIALATPNIVPQFMLAVVADLRFSERVVGLLSSCMMAGAMVSAIAAAFWVRRISWHRAAYICLVGLLAANAASLLWHSLAVFFALQCIVGFCGGSLYSLVLIVLSEARVPDRAFGYTIAGQAVYGVAGLLAGPWLVELAGLNGILGTLVLLGIIGLPLVTFLPRRGRLPATEQTANGFFKVSTLLALFGCFFFFFNVGCYWTYIELMGSAAGLGMRELSNGLALGVTFGIVGGLLASWLGEKKGRLLPIAACAVGTVVAASLLLGKHGLPGFVASVVAYNFVWNLSLAYQYASVNAADTTGRGLAAAPAFHNAGSMVGPAIASLLISPGDLRSVVWLVNVSALASLACFGMSAWTKPVRPHLRGASCSDGL